jgi:hypothetical protein
MISVACSEITQTTYSVGFHLQSKAFRENNQQCRVSLGGRSQPSRSYPGNERKRLLACCKQENDRAKRHPEKARQFGRCRYRKIVELPGNTAGWIVTAKQVERIWRHQGLKGPAEQSLNPEPNLIP